MALAADPVEHHAGDPHGLVVGVEPHQARHRPEDLFPRHRHALRDTAQHGRGDEESSGQPVIGRERGLVQQLGALGEGGLEVVIHAVALARVDQRPDVGLGGQGVADDE